MLAGPPPIQRPANVQSAERNREERRVRDFLLAYLEGDPSNIEQQRPTTYILAFADLNGDGRDEPLVYLEGRNWCGSGGCNLLILADTGRSYTVVGDSTIVQLPIRILTTTSNGWRDIAVWVQGGGIQPGYEARLPFDGRRYPRNPSVKPSRRAGRNAPGEVIVPKGAEGQPLYP